MSTRKGVIQREAHCKSIAHGPRVVLVRASRGARCDMRHQLMRTHPQAQRCMCRVSVYWPLRDSGLSIFLC
jgi:hypothetical protein